MPDVGNDQLGAMIGRQARHFKQNRLGNLVRPQPEQLKCVKPNLKLVNKR